ncbi:phenylalanine--tRNA ligase subunit beta [Coralliovum pocilloporae]|uniref:phenylalanine--tRNA ligase subunit beta n=1 Tax=Coralliovum pocilloporae TaxID=3066369 RepID=UPI003307ABF4
MKFTLSWLKEYLDTDASLDEILEKLTVIGLEVEEVVDRARELAAFTVAYVEEAEQHPNADRLRVCKVNTGSEVLQIVCGAPNARAGIKVVLAQNGSTIPANGMVLRPTSIRDVDSNGMMCSEREMGLSDEHDGIIELPEDAPIGEPFAPVLGLDDPIIDIAITPNRGDCLGVYGVARDLAAAGLGELKENTPKPVAGSFKSPVDVHLNFDAETANACPVFAGRYVRGVKNGPSPKWMQDRLRAIGLRPINALVDITNYVSYDRGRPLHVYDADKLNGNIQARLGREGESFLALDGKDYAVDETMCVIADDTSVLGFGGIMGGEESGSTNETVNVFIECAWFDPIRTATTGRKAGINSDARYRFERTVDPESVIPGADLATQMVLDLCGGEASEPVLAGEVPTTDRIIEFPLTEVKRLTGLDVPLVEIKAILKRLGFWMSGASDVVKVAVPSFRPDVYGKADLVEEVMRIVGVDRVPLQPLPRIGTVGQKILTTGQIRKNRARRALAARGMVEAVTWSFISEEQAKHFGGGDKALQLANPISSDLSDMRPSLFAGLLAAAQRNADRGVTDSALFEVGQVFHGDQPDDQKTVATGIRKNTAVLTGSGRDWAGNSASVSVFDAKADAFAVLEALGMETSKLQIVAEAPGIFHPGRSGRIQLGPKNHIGWFGELHPSTLELMDVDGPVCGFEIVLDAIPQPKAKATRTKPALVLSDLMAVKRDFAFEVDKDVSAQSIMRAAMSADKKLITNASVFDVYAGEHMAEGRKSVAIEVMLQPKDKTLTDVEIEAVGSKIVAAVEKATKGTLRG